MDPSGSRRPVAARGAAACGRDASLTSRGPPAPAVRKEAPRTLAIESSTKAKVVQIVEVRRAMEAEAAALAAERATPGDVQLMRQALQSIDDAVAKGGGGVDEDLAFHLSIAESTGNQVMVATVRYLGEVLRSGIRVTRANEARRRDFIEAVRSEHHAIVEAIEVGDAVAARAAARRHMHHAAKRLQDADARFWDTAQDVEIDLKPAD